MCFSMFSIVRVFFIFFICRVLLYVFVFRILMVFMFFRCVCSSFPISASHHSLHLLYVLHFISLFFVCVHVLHVLRFVLVLFVSIFLFSVVPEFLQCPNFSFWVKFGHFSEIIIDCFVLAIVCFIVVCVFNIRLFGFVCFSKLLHVSVFSAVSSCSSLSALFQFA